MWGVLILHLLNLILNFKVDGFLDFDYPQLLVHV